MSVFIEDPSNKAAFDRFQPLPAAGPAVDMLRAAIEVAHQRGTQAQPAGREEPQVIYFLDEAAWAKGLITGEPRSGKNVPSHLFRPDRDTWAIQLDSL